MPRAESPDPPPKEPRKLRLEKIVFNGLSIYANIITQTRPVRNAHDSNKLQNIIYKISNGMRLLNTILDIVFPVNCLACGKAGTDLCAACLAAAPGAEREGKKWIFPLYDYHHPPVKKALWLLKYKGKKGLAGI